MKSIKSFLMNTAGRLLIFIMSMLAPAAAFAAVSCTPNYSAITVSGLPPSIAVASNAPNGLLTPWVMMAQKNNLYTCTVTNSWYAGATFEYGGMSSVQQVSTIDYNGAPFKIFPTNISGVGIAIGGYVINPVSGTAGPFSLRFTGYENKNGTNLNYGGYLVVALVKTGPIAFGGVIPGGTIAKGYTLEGPTNTFNYINYDARLAIDYNINPIEIRLLTCTTPDVYINLGDHGPGVGDLSAVNATSKNPADVPLRFENCPGGTAIAGTSAGLIHSIRYQIKPTDYVAGFQNVAALSGDSTAKGVGIQLYDNAGAVLPYEQWQQLSGFNGTSANSYTVPLKARYYRTGDLSAGTANSKMMMLVEYQ